MRRTSSNLPHFQVDVKNMISVAHLTRLASQRVFLLYRPWMFWHGWGQPRAKTGAQGTNRV